MSRVSKGCWVVALCSALTAFTLAHGETVQQPQIDIASRLTAAYPAHVEAVRDGKVIFRDGTTLALDDGVEKSPPQWLADPDIEDMFRFSYPAGADALAPAPDVDPGRARNAAFFTKVYGDCRTPGFARTLVDVVWLPKKSGQRLKVSPANDMARRLEAVSNELDALDATFDRFLVPSAGTFNCRTVAGTATLSAHGYAIAIDIATRHADYWRWARDGDSDAVVRYRNAIPMEIVRIFEQHGFIWGGRWHHYDTMHFEYRPELVAPTAPLPPAR